MALDTSANFQLAIADWLNRSDLTARIPDFIALCEAKIRRKLKRKTIRNASWAITLEYQPLPNDCSEMRSIRLVSSMSYLDKPIALVTPEALSDHRAAFQNIAGRPQWASVVDGNLLFVPKPDQSYVADITYFEKFTSLNSASSNSILAESPDIYLYGVLMEAAPYLEHEERIPVWENRFENAIADAEVQLNREEYAGSTHPARLPVVFGCQCRTINSRSGSTRRRLICSSRVRRR